LKIFFEKQKFQKIEKDTLNTEREKGKNLGGVELVKNGREGSGEIWSVSDLADASLDAPLSYLF